jgi:hypothetical protein
MFSEIFIKWCQSYYDNNNNVDDDAVAKSSFFDEIAILSIQKIIVFR